MKIKINTDSYNSRRYGCPWIATVSFDVDGKVSYNFGDWVGDHRNCGEGVLSLEVEEGDIVARGQKDNRGKKNSPEFFVVDGDYQLDEIGDKGDAYKYFLSKHEKTDREKLIQEKESLLKRLAEIENLLNIH